MGGAMPDSFHDMVIELPSIVDPAPGTMNSTSARADAEKIIRNNKEYMVGSMCRFRS